MGLWIIPFAKTGVDFHGVRSRDCPAIPVCPNPARRTENVNVWFVIVQGKKTMAWNRNVVLTLRLKNRDKQGNSWIYFDRHTPFPFSFIVCSLVRLFVCSAYCAVLWSDVMWSVPTCKVQRQEMRMMPWSTRNPNRMRSQTIQWTWSTRAPGKTKRRRGYFVTLGPNPTIYPPCFNTQWTEKVQHSVLNLTPKQKQETFA